MLDKNKLNKIFQHHAFTAVMHFAGLKSVSESISKPMEYYEINLGSKLKNKHWIDVLKYFCLVKALWFFKNLKPCFIGSILKQII